MTTDEKRLALLLELRALESLRRRTPEQRERRRQIEIALERMAP